MLGPNLEIKYTPQYLTESRADQLYQTCLSDLPWRQESIMLFGQRRLQPRQQVWMGDTDASYRYSGTDFQPFPWHPELRALADRLAEVLQYPFNSVLCNWYCGGQHSMGWHSDDESELGLEPVIASISLGESRRFLLRRKDDHKDKHEYGLGHGDLLVMYGQTQRYWQHSVPKTRRSVGDRVNLTFRRVQRPR